VSADASDAIDERLLAEGAHGELLARHYPALVDRARLRMRDEGEAMEVVHMAVDRLARELRRGRRYEVPFRVVAHQVLTWTIKDWHALRAAGPGSLPATWDRPEEEAGFGEVEHRLSLAQLFASLPARDRQVMTMRWIEGEEISDIAAALGMKRNAVDQALHRGAARIREGLDRG